MVEKEKIGIKKEKEGKIPGDDEDGTAKPAGKEGRKIKGTYTAKDEKMISYLEYAKTLTAKFPLFDIDQIPRDLNTQADALASLGYNFTPAIFFKIPIVHLLEPAISKPGQVNPVSTDNNSWTKPYYDWFLRGILPQDMHEARAFRIKTSTYSIINNTLFKRSQPGPYIRCLEPDEAKQVLQEVHDGYCDNHKGGRSLASKVLRTGYYWPTLRADCLEYCAKCEAC
ncbi:uncharacterized protein LOC141600929 [Silene latifolia]|uniref:uncharacterized protein LOC141600929 n=1 Tax=Silene latifolia TaxID=37657 RepID=UPI003D771ED4